MDKKKLIEALQSDKEIYGAILFGSEAKKMANHESDIDIALLYNAGKKPSSWDLMQFQQNPTDLMHQQVDIVVLNDASPIIAMQVIKNGIPLFIRDQKEYQKFEITLITDYADLKKIREPFEKNILKRRLHG